jgi:hypothetical protein
MSCSYESGSCAQFFVSLQGFLPDRCVQVVYKKAGLKGLKLDLSNAESTTDS